ncbi:MAG: tetratricopeptide repeat protein [Actinobacteria bacterium]|nr:tetratricopeptide repeat protein [Actinomycetota bacterium]MCL5883609.1 tetratricopeptide repeat protein [Actinomycetota bacterium]
MEEEAAIQFQSTEGKNSAMTSKILNIAIGIAAVALLVTGGVLAYLHFRPADNPSSLERTLQKWQQAVDADPGNSLLRANLGATYLDMGDTDNAIKELRLALDQQPDSFTYMFKLGMAYRQAGNMDDAVTMFQGSADSNPKTEKYASLFEVANTYMMKGDLGQAKDFCQQSIEDNGMIWNSHYLMGQLLEKDGDNEGAKTQYETAIKFNPDESSLREALQRVSG